MSSLCFVKAILAECKGILDDWAGHVAKTIRPMFEVKENNKELPDFEIVPLVPFQQVFHTKLIKLPRRLK